MKVLFFKVKNVINNEKVFLKYISEVLSSLYINFLDDEKYEILFDSILSLFEIDELYEIFKSLVELTQSNTHPRYFRCFSLILNSHYVEDEKEYFLNKISSDNPDIIPFILKVSKNSLNSQNSIHFNGVFESYIDLLSISNENINIKDIDEDVLIHSNIFKNYIKSNSTNIFNYSQL